MRPTEDHRRTRAQSKRRSVQVCELGATRSSRSINASLSVSGNLEQCGLRRALGEILPEFVKAHLNMPFVSSSMNSGTPSVFWIIWSISRRGTLPPLNRSRIMFFTSVCDNRVSECMVTVGDRPDVGRNSGRHDTISSTRAWSIRLIISALAVEVSRDLASAHPLKTQTVGRCNANAEEHVDKRIYRSVLYLWGVSSQLFAIVFDGD